MATLYPGNVPTVAQPADAAGPVIRTIQLSDLHDALSGTHGDNHNDLIQILGGGPWTIVRSHFGQRNNGAAQVYVDPRSGPRRRRCRRRRRPFSNRSRATGGRSTR